MFTLRRLFEFWALVAFVLSLAGEVRAQATPTITLPVSGVKRRLDRGGNLLNTQINFKDCDLNENIEFNVAVTNPSDKYTLQVWAGSNCEQLTNRNNPAILTCWQIGPENLTVTTVNPAPIKVPVQQILYGRTLASGRSTGASANGGSSGTAGTDNTAGTTSTAGADSTGGGGTGGTGGGGTGGVAAAAGTSGGTAGSSSSTLTDDKDPCRPKDSTTAAQNISVYFMLVDGSSTIQGMATPWNASYKLLAPAAPDKVSADVGDTLLPISFNYTDKTTSDITIDSYTFYCDPPPGVAAAQEAGVLPVEGGVVPTSCSGIPSDVLVQGARTTNLDAYRCGGAGKSSNGGNATGLVNGVAYHVAVATTDSYRNTGTLSVTTCAVPQLVTGFYKAYTDAGGKGGGGFCSFSRHRETFTLFALLGCASCLFLRRRRAT
ncbi:MAG: hypothetical protein ABJB12_00975 [Pseudomonadota bacterium]